MKIFYINFGLPHKKIRNLTVSDITDILVSINTALFLISAFSFKLYCTVDKSE